VVLRVPTSRQGAKDAKCAQSLKRTPLRVLCALPAFAANSSTRQPLFASNCTRIP
jgi:hypothetical protein